MYSLNKKDFVENLKEYEFISLTLATINKGPFKKNFFSSNVEIILISDSSNLFCEKYPFEEISSNKKITCLYQNNNLN